MPAGDGRGTIVSTIWQRKERAVPTAEWGELHDHHNSKGEPLPPEPDGPLDELWSLLTVKQQQAVASGRIDLEELLESITTTNDLELCSRCSVDYVPKDSRLGVCHACARRIANERLEGKLREIDAQREADVAKQRVHRRRVELGLPLPRSDRTYPTSDAPVHRECPICGTLVPDHGADGPCVECELRAERRARAASDTGARMV